MQELQVVTINDSEGELAEYLVLNDMKKRAPSVRRDFKRYQFFETENKPNSMKYRFKTNKVLIAVKDIGHTITTAEVRTIHKKLASSLNKFQPLKKPEPRKHTKRCRRCEKSPTASTAKLTKGRQEQLQPHSGQGRMQPYVPHHAVY